MIEIKNVSYAYSKDEALAINNISLTVKEGSWISILGHNGSGKSTLAKLLVGLVKADSGEIIVDESVLTEDNIGEIRKKIGIVFQNPDNQFVGVTVRHDIAFGLENRRVNREEMQQRIVECAAKVGLADYLEREPYKLSGGEKQRVAIAGILALDSKYIIFDEATSMLDPKCTKEFLDVIKELKGKKTIIYITHNLDEALYADRVMVMNGGKIVLNGNVMDVFNEKEIIREAKLEVFDNLKLIDIIKNDTLKNKEEVVEFLWQLTYQK